MDQTHGAENEPESAGLETSNTYTQLVARYSDPEVVAGALARVRAEARRRASAEDHALSGWRHGPFAGAAAAAPLRVVVADHNPVVRAGLTAVLSGRSDITVVAEAADGRQTHEAVAHHRPDVVLLDVHMHGVDVISALPYLVQIAPVMILTYSRELEIVQEALRRGASGYLVHGEFAANELVAAVRDIKEGLAAFTPTAVAALAAELRQDGGTQNGPLLPEGLSSATAYDGSPASERAQGSRPAAAVDRSRYQLSQREAEIMHLITSGMNNQQIAATCFISEKTVKNHINRIFTKLDTTSRTDAIAKWLGSGEGTG